MEFALESVDTKTLSESGVEVVIKKMNSKEPLLDANGKPVTIKVMGPDSTKYRSLSRSQIRKRLTRMAAGQKEVTEADMDETESDGLDILAACTISWTGVLTPKGEEIPCNAENARKLYLHYPVVKEQIDAFISERENFLRASSKA